MNCPICQNESDRGARFCGICGTEMSSNEVITGATQPRVGFGTAIGLGFKNYFKFKGRSTRAEYWWFVLFYFLVSLIPIVNWFVWVVFIIPTISLTTRRLHDIEKTGWWQLWYTLISIATWGTFLGAMLVGIEESMASLFVLSGLTFVAAVASIVWIILWLVRQGDVGSNKYGPDPRTNLI